MTRKTKRGIMGKTTITRRGRPRIGPGIGFHEMGLTSGREIKAAARQSDLEFNEDEDI